MPEPIGAGAEPQEPNEPTGAEPGVVQKTEPEGALTDEDFVKALQEAGLKDKYESLVQSITDKRVTEAIKTHDKKVKDKLKEQQRKEEEEKKKVLAEGTMSESEKKVSQLEASLAQLTGMFGEFMGTVKKQKLDTLKDEAIKAAGLPEEAVQLLDVTEEAQIAEKIKLIQLAFGKLKDREMDNWASGQNQPFRSTGNSVSSKIEQVRKYIKDTQEHSGQGAAAAQLGLIKK